MPATVVTSPSTELHSTIGSVQRYCDISQPFYEASHTSKITLVVVGDEDDELCLKIKLIRKQVTGYASMKMIDI